jgi:hypothetical protein
MPVQAVIWPLDEMSVFKSFKNEDLAMNSLPELLPFSSQVSTISSITAGK